MDGLSRLHRAVIITLDPGVSVLVVSFSFHHRKSKNKLYLVHSKILILVISVHISLTHQSVLQQTPAKCPTVLTLSTWRQHGML